MVDAGRDDLNIDPLPRGYMWSRVDERVRIIAAQTQVGAH